MTDTVSELTLARLVDGDLNDSERAGLLRRLEEQPDQWRTLALMFVEAQVWDATIPAAVSDRRSPIPAEGPQPRSASTGPGTRSPATRWLPMVAAVSLLLASLTGFAAGRFVSGESHRVEPVTGEDQPPRHVAAELSFEEAIARSAVPLPTQFQMGLLKAGYLVDEQHKLRPVILPTGERIEVPVREVSVRYLGAAAFQ